MEWINGRHDLDRFLGVALRRLFRARLLGADVTSSPDWPEDWDENWDDESTCQCGEALHGSAHYHCASCGEVVGMMGHLSLGGHFTCTRVPGWWNS